MNYAKDYVGDVLEVIPERAFKEDPTSGLMMGYSDNYLNVVFPGSEEMIGKVCKVKIDEAGSEYCKGTLVRVLENTNPSFVGESAV